jgi:hypothetical protein
VLLVAAQLTIAQIGIAVAWGPEGHVVIAMIAEPLERCNRCARGELAIEGMKVVTLDDLGGTKREERPSVTGIEHLDGTQIRRASQRVHQLQLIEHLVARVTAQYGYIVCWGTIGDDDRRHWVCDFGGRWLTAKLITPLPMPLNRRWSRPMRSSPTQRPAQQTPLPPWSPHSSEDSPWRTSLELRGKPGHLATAAARIGLLAVLAFGDEGGVALVPEHEFSSLLA